MAKFEGKIGTSYYMGNKEAAMDFYDKWADEYDKEVEEEKGHYSQALAAVVLAHVHDKDIRVLDVGAGTGEAGRILRANGFNRIDALDGSEQMLEVAKRKGIYDNVYHEVLQADKLPANVPHNTYDLVMGSGIFCPGHMNRRHLKALAAPAKKGGKVIFTINGRWVGEPDQEFPDWHYGIEETVRKLEEDGYWRRLLEGPVEYTKGDPNSGLGYVLEILK